MRSSALPSPFLICGCCSGFTEATWPTARGGGMGGLFHSQSPLPPVAPLLYTTLQAGCLEPWPQFLYPAVGKQDKDLVISVILHQANLRLSLWKETLGSPVFKQLLSQFFSSLPYFSVKYLTVNFSCDLKRQRNYIHSFCISFPCS